MSDVIDISKHFEKEIKDEEALDWEPTDAVEYLRDRFRDEVKATKFVALYITEEENGDQTLNFSAAGIDKADLLVMLRQMENVTMENWF